MEARRLHPLDWVLFAVVLFVSFAIGVYYGFTGDRQKTTKEFLLANRRLRVIPTSISMIVSALSSIYILGQSAEVYLHGPQMYIGIIGACVAHMLSALLFVPTFYKLKLTSGYQYLNRRFESRKLRLTCVVLSIGASLIHSALNVYAPSTALEAVTGFPWWASLLLLGTISTAYTALGGMKAVIWTDVFQACVMCGGLLALMILGTMRVGGVGKVFEHARNGGRLTFFNFNPDPTVRVSFWSVIIGRLFFDMARFGAVQANIQRYCALPTLTKARLSLIANIPFLVFLTTSVVYLGLVMYAYFTDIGCDPLRSRAISNANQLLPYFVVTVMNYPGVPGLFLSVLFSASLSTLSSNLTSQSALSWKDIFEPHLVNISERKKAIATKILVLIFGILSMGLGSLVRFLPGHVLEVSRRAVGALSGPLQGVFILAMFFPFTNVGGTFSGIVVSVGLAIWVNMGSYFTRPHRAVLETTVTNCSMPANISVLPVPTDPPAWTIFPLYRISFMWIPIFATTICILVGLVISCVLHRSQKKSVDPRLIIPVSNYCCFFLPEPARRFLWCGVDHDAQHSQEINLDEEQGGRSGKEWTNQNPIETQPRSEHDDAEHSVYDNPAFVRFRIDNTKL